MCCRCTTSEIGCFVCTVAQLLLEARSIDTDEHTRYTIIPARFYCPAICERDFNVCSTRACMHPRAAATRPFTTWVSVCLYVCCAYSRLVHAWRALVRSYEQMHVRVRADSAKRRKEVGESLFLRHRIASQPRVVSLPPTCSSSSCGMFSSSSSFRENPPLVRALYRCGNALGFAPPQPPRRSFVCGFIFLRCRRVSCVCSSIIIILEQRALHNSRSPAQLAHT